MTDRLAAEVFPPGSFIKEELEARGWTQEDLAEVLGRDTRLVSEIINGKRSITLETATGLAAAFGTSAELWMNLQTSYQLWRERSKHEGSDVARRAKIYEKAPVKLMLRRNWIHGSDNVTVLEKRILDFFTIKRLDEEPAFWEYAARKGTPYYKTLTPEQRAWLFRAKHLSKAIDAKTFAESRLLERLEQLRLFRTSMEELRRLSRLLADGGVRFLIIEHLPRTRIDGVCFWLDENSPVIAMSLRYDRIDWFWHTLMHEIKHVLNRDGLREHTHLDSDLVGDKAEPTNQKPDFEQEADRFAADFLVPQAELNDFTARCSPLYSKMKIKQFAARIQVHPGIVVGQLQYRGEIPYAHSREMLVPVREIVIGTTLTDGWGHMPPAL